MTICSLNKFLLIPLLLFSVQRTKFLSQPRASHQLVPMVHDQAQVHIGKSFGPRGKLKIPSAGNLADARNMMEFWFCLQEKNYANKNAWKLLQVRHNKEELYADNQGLNNASSQAK